MTSVSKQPDILKLMNPNGQEPTVHKRTKFWHFILIGLGIQVFLSLTVILNFDSDFMYSAAFVGYAFIIIGVVQGIIVLAKKILDRL